MSASLIHLLLATTVASSLGVFIVAGLRKPLRYLAGARAAYWIWLLVPASVVALWVPGPRHSVRMGAVGLQVQSTRVFSNAILSVDTAIQSSSIAVAVIAIWLVGAVVLLGLLIHRQRAFVRDLGSLVADADGILQSASVRAPLLLGVCHARIVVPSDFEVRYSKEERALVLAHEHAHAARRDIAVNALASLWLCFSWFNPLMYWALGRLRFDQDLACDAIALGAKHDRSGYAKVLLKSQLAGDAVPLGCNWQSTHPLKERIAMLKYPFAGTTRRTTGVAFAICVAMVGSYAAWATQSDAPAADADGNLIAVNMRWWVNGKGVPQVSGPIASQDIRVGSGNVFVEKVSFGAGQSFETRCKASLSNQDRKTIYQSMLWEAARYAGYSIQGKFLFECTLITNDEAFSTPSLFVGDGKLGTIEASNPEGSVNYKLELRASSAPAAGVAP